MKSILSDLPDGFGFFYGYAEGDYRQINVRREARGLTAWWIAYVGGEEVAASHTKHDAEAAALSWMEENLPDEDRC